MKLTHRQLSAALAAAHARHAATVARMKKLLREGPVK